MGIHMQYLRAMEEKGLLCPGGKVLDIGSSNLYGANVEEVLAFLEKYSPEGRSAAGRALAEKLAAGSVYQPGKGGSNQAFIGQLLEAAGMEYLAMDIAQGYRTLVLDLNRQALPRRYQRYFDLVLNFGTSEHIFNQLNSFKVIHEATKVGGHMVHQVPSVGFTDHCYFTYTGRFFFDLAGFNEYDIVAFWFTGPAGEADLFASLASYASYFPLLGEVHQKEIAQGPGSAFHEVHIPNIAITIVYRKKKDRPFMGAIECQTSVGEIPQEVKDHYQQVPGKLPPSGQPVLVPKTAGSPRKSVMARVFTKVARFFKAAG